MMEDIVYRSNQAIRRMFQSSWPLLFILTLSATLGLLSLRSVQIGQPADDADYLILAESLASGHGLRLINYPSAPAEQWFPAGWPMLLSPILLISPKNYELTRLLPFIFTLLSIAAAYMVGCLYWRREIQLTSVLLFALAPAIVLGAGSPMSEPAYITFSLFGIVFVERLLVGKQLEWRVLLAASLLIAAAIAVRTIGYTLLGAAVIYLLLRHRAKFALALLFLTSVLLIPQFVQNISAGGAVMSPQYQVAISGGLTDKLSHSLQNLNTYLSNTIPTLLVGLFGPQVDRLLQTYGLGWTAIALKGAVSGAVCVGFVASLREFRLHQIYTGLFMAATLLYYNPASGSAHPRYVVPILLFLIAYLLIGTVTVVQFFARILRVQDKRRRYVSQAALIVLTTAIVLISVGRNIQQGVTSPLRDRMTDVSAGASWIALHTPSTAIVAMPNPVPRYIYAQRKVLDFPSVTTPQDLLTWFESQGVTHLLIGPPLRPNLDIALDDYQMTYVLPLLQAHPEYFRLEYRDDRWNVKVFSIQNQ